MDRILRVLEMNSAPRELDSDYAEDVITSNQFVPVAREIREALVSEDECKKCGFIPVVQCGCDVPENWKAKIALRLWTEWAKIIKFDRPTFTYWLTQQKEE